MTTQTDRLTFAEKALEHAQRCDGQGEQPVASRPCCANVGATGRTPVESSVPPVPQDDTNQQDERDEN